MDEWNGTEWEAVWSATRRVSPVPLFTLFPFPAGHLSPPCPFPSSPLLSCALPTVAPRTSLFALTVKRPPSPVFLFLPFPFLSLYVSDLGWRPEGLWTPGEPPLVRRPLFLSFFPSLWSSSGCPFLSAPLVLQSSGTLIGSGPRARARGGSLRLGRRSTSPSQVSARGACPLRLFLGASGGRLDTCFLPFVYLDPSAWSPQTERWRFSARGEQRAAATATTTTRPLPRGVCESSRSPRRSSAPSPARPPACLPATSLPRARAPCLFALPLRSSSSRPASGAFSWARTRQRAGLALAYGFCAPERPSASRWHRRCSSWPLRARATRSPDAFFVGCSADLSFTHQRLPVPLSLHLPCLPTTAAALSALGIRHRFPPSRRPVAGPRGGISASHRSLSVVSSFPALARSRTLGRARPFRGRGRLPRVVSRRPPFPGVRLLLFLLPHSLIHACMVHHSFFFLVDTAATHAPTTSCMALPLIHAMRVSTTPLFPPFLPHRNPATSCVSSFASIARALTASRARLPFPTHVRFPSAPLSFLCHPLVCPVFFPPFFFVSPFAHPPFPQP